METGKKWLEEHLETFVKPYLGKIPNLPSDKEGAYIASWNYWTNPKIITALKVSWNEAKKLAKDKKILLPGRDVWEFEILARLEGYPTVFRPDISTAVAPHVEEDYSDCCCIDTGFKGSVPKAMGIKDFRLISYMPETKKITKTKKAHQIFPYMQQGQQCKISGFILTRPSVIYELPSAMEGSNKYWHSAQPKYEKDPVTGKYRIKKPLEVIQDLHPSSIFTYAAQTTQLIAKSVLK